MGAVERKRARKMEDAMDASEEMHVTNEKRRRFGGPHLAFVVKKEVATEHAQ